MHPASQVTAVNLRAFAKTGGSGKMQAYEFEGVARSVGRLFGINWRNTYVKGWIRCSFDQYGRIREIKYGVVDKRDL
ncbi:MAG: hypothetical protein GY862_27310 [Gammaproteobacteria bacterium]|nr:hypothetical protein [Gammaproteobacteria bacterium]